MATLNIPDDMTIAELASMAHAVGKSLSASIFTNRPEDTPNGRNTRLTADQPGSRVAAGQHHTAGDQHP